MMNFLTPVFLILIISNCTTQTQSNQVNNCDSVVHHSNEIIKTDTEQSGKQRTDKVPKDTLFQRFSAPKNYKRTPVNGFASYLRHLKLKPKGSLAYYYNGQTKDSSNVYCAVVDQSIGNRNLHQCADAIMRQYASFLYEHKMYNKISFTFQSGFKFPFSRWARGYRIKTNGNEVRWYKAAQPAKNKKVFEGYLTMVYSYCGTASLERQLKHNKRKISDLKAGDLFIDGGHPGHAVLVMDVVQNNEGNKLFLLAQSYMPAQQMQILINPNNENLSPWYRVKEIESQLKTPEWVFDRNDLLHF